MSIFLKAALAYSAAGYKVFPCLPGGKTPAVSGGFHTATTDEAQIHQWWNRWPNANVGLPTGAVNGIAVLDVDAKNKGFDSLAAIELIYGRPDTVEAKTGGGGKHFAFRYVEGVGCTTNLGGKSGLDLRGDGGFIIVSPSIHASGNSYEWVKPLGKSPLAPCPQWLLDMYRTKQGKKKITETDSGMIGEGGRNDALFRYGCTLRGRDGFDEATIYAMLCAVNELHCTPPLSDEEVRQIASSAAKYSKARSVFASPDDTGHLETADLRFFELTDVGNAAMLRAARVGVLAYCEDYKKWLVWDERVWAARPASFARAVAAELMEAAQEQRKDDETAAKFYRQCRNKGRLDAMVSLAEPLLPIRADELDKDKHLLNCQNGIVNLRTGELMPHDAKCKMSRITKGDYRPGYYPDWQKIVERIIPDKELRDFVQRFAGYSATGSTGEEKFIFAKGPGGAGKGTLMETISEALGDYSDTITPDVLMQARETGGNGNEASPEIAKLRGVRFLLTSETKNGATFDEAKLKRITGGDKLTARRLHGEPFTFKPEFSLWISSNSSPNVRDHSDGVWRRLLTVPFEQRFTAGNTDAGLKDRLLTKEMLSQVIAWLVDGAAEWYRAGLQVPDSVKLRTEEYKADADFFGSFIRECCEEEKEIVCRAQELYDRYRQYCNACGNHPLNQQNFNSVMADRGFGRTRRKHGYVWLGIKPLLPFVQTDQYEDAPQLMRVK